MVSTIPQESKTNYYKQYFEANTDNIKNTWKGIKFIITVKMHLLIFQSAYLPMALQL